MELVPNEESSAKFHCECCEYFTSRKSQYDRHLETIKHKNLTNPIKKFEVQQKYNCVCGRTYKHLSTLHNHKKQCGKFLPKNKDELIIQLLKQNADLMEIFKTGTNVNCNNTTNSHNKAFNLQFFLNETCKDAMNINDFIDSIKLQVSDLERIGELGFVEGISGIITSNLKALDITKRPIHCTDKKRETIYIKDENQWTKDDENSSNLRNAVRKVANRNIRLLPQFREKYPEHNNSYSKQSDIYDKMIVEVMSTQTDKEDKIIKNISKIITIDK